MNHFVSTAREARVAGRPSFTDWDGKEPLILADGWALGCDRNQWFVMRVKKHKSSIKWQPVSYVGSNTAVLSRVLREKGIKPPDGVETHLNAAESFLEWHRRVTERHHGG